MGKIINRVSEVAGKNRMQIADLAREAKIAYDTAKGLWMGTSTRLDLSTLASICEALQCQPGDLLIYVNESDNGDHQ